MVIIEFLKILIYSFVSMIKVIVSLLLIYQQLSDIQDQLIASVLSVPVFLVSSASAVIGIIKFISKHFGGTLWL